MNSDTPYVVFEAMYPDLAADLVLPFYATPGAAGLDLVSPQPMALHPGARGLIRLGWRVEIELGWYGRIAPRSGLAWKDGIDVLAGVIDADYRGELGVILINFGQDIKYIQTGDRIAQMIIERCGCALVGRNRLSDSERAGGFGSTGS